MTPHQMEDMANMMNKLSEPDRIRESVILQAMEQVVDDPNKTQDWNDVNMNGDTKELLTNFEIWYLTRLKDLGKVTDNITPLVGGFFNNSVTPFSNEMRLVNQPGGTMARQDYALDPDGQAIDNPGGDGAIVALLRPLYAAGYKTMQGTHEMWQPGPTPLDLNNYMAEGCDSNGYCPRTGPDNVPAGYDYVDSMADDFLYMADFMDTLKTRSAADLVTTWNSWIVFFYDIYSYNPDGTLKSGATPDPAAFYERLQAHINNLQQLKNQIIDIRDHRIGVCGEGWFVSGACKGCVPGAGHWEYDDFGNHWWKPDCGNCAFNPPCRFASGGDATIDQDRNNDEFANALSGIDNLIAQMANFRNAIGNFVQAAESVSAQVPTGNCLVNCSGNCANYCWTDARGDHTVLVELGPYVVPYIKTDKSGGFLSSKTCNFIYPDDWRIGDGSMDQNKCWVKITRYDQTKNLGPMGDWNPFVRPVVKAARAWYNWDKVALK